MLMQLGVSSNGVLIEIEREISSLPREHSEVVVEESAIH